LRDASSTSSSRNKARRTLLVMDFAFLLADLVETELVSAEGSDV
jgi:hypothetical protein